MTKPTQKDDNASREGHRERLRNRFKAGGISALSDYEQVELLLTYFIPRIDVKPIAKALVGKFKNVRGIIDTPFEELTKVKGVGESTALGLSLLKNLITTYHQNELEIPSNEMGTITKLIKYFKSKIASEPSEVVELVCFDAKLKIIPAASSRIQEGSLSSASVDVRKIMEIAIKHGAASIAIAHNHPSGDPTPSFEDKRFTARLSKACKPIHLSFIEHVVVGKNVCFSFRRDGYFDYLYDESLLESRLRGRCQETDKEAEKKCSTVPSKKAKGKSA